MEKLIEYIKTIHNPGEEALTELASLVRVENYQKNGFLLEAGRRCGKIWFINSGMIRKYYINDDREVTLWIHTEGEILTSLPSYFQQVASNEYLQACEDTEVVAVTKSSSLKLSKYPGFVAFNSVLMEKQFTEIDIHTREFSSRDALGRYEYLCTIAPEMVKRAKLGHIASILGITQETLSRIRKQQ